MIIFSQIKVCIVTKLRTKLIFIYIALIQLLDRDILSLSLKALCYGLTP